MTINRAVVIGASGGIGKAMTAALLAREVPVHALARSPIDLSHPRLTNGVIDIENEETIGAAAQTAAEHGSSDLVFVATGVLHGRGTQPEKSIRDLSAASFARAFAVNATGPALVAKHFLPLLPRTGRSVFAALSARVGSIGDNRLGGWYAYRASKAALNMIIKSLSIELARSRPEALCIGLHPGTVDTDLSKPFQKGVPPEKLFDPAFSAARLLDTIEGLSAADTGRCFAWDGSLIQP